MRFQFSLKDFFMTIFPVVSMERRTTQQPDINGIILLALLSTRGAGPSQSFVLLTVGAALIR